MIKFVDSKLYISICTGLLLAGNSALKMLAKA